MARISSQRKKAAETSATRRRSANVRSANTFYGDFLGIAGSLLRNRQQAGADKIASMAGAARNFADSLGDSPSVQSYAEAAADQMDSLSGYVSETGMEDIVNDAMDLARRHPVSAAAFAVAVGFAFTRLMTHDNTTQRATRPKSRAQKSSQFKTVADQPKPRVARKAKPNGRNSSYERPNAA
jgi:hypothetical protein